MTIRSNFYALFMTISISNAWSTGLEPTDDLQHPQLSIHQKENIAITDDWQTVLEKFRPLFTDREVEDQFILGFSKNKGEEWKTDQDLYCRLNNLYSILENVKDQPSLFNSNGESKLVEQQCDEIKRFDQFTATARQCFQISNPDTPAAWPEIQKVIKPVLLSQTVVNYFMNSFGALYDSKRKPKHQGIDMTERFVCLLGKLLRASAQQEELGEEAAESLQIQALTGALAFPSHIVIIRKSDSDLASRLKNKPACSFCLRSEPASPRPITPPLAPISLRTSQGM